MCKPLIFIRGLNIIPLLSHTRNVEMIRWADKTEFIIPLFEEKLIGKPVIVVKDKLLVVEFIQDNTPAEDLRSPLVN